ncbi:hypothetical protein LguiB_032719 [Lonicera macranthoides]
MAANRLQLTLCIYISLMSTCALKREHFLPSPFLMEAKLAGVMGSPIIKQHEASNKDSNLRNLLWATSKHDVYLMQNYSAMHWSSLLRRGKEVLDVARPIIPTMKYPGSVSQSLSRVHISTMTVKDNLMVAGGFKGELICKNTSVSPDGKSVAVLGDSAYCFVADAQSGKAEEVVASSLALLKHSCTSYKSYGSKFQPGIIVLDSGGREIESQLRPLANAYLSDYIGGVDPFIHQTKWGWTYSND